MRRARKVADKLLTEVAVCVCVWREGRCKRIILSAQEKKNIQSGKKCRKKHELACFRHSTAPNIEVTKLKGFTKQLLRHRLRCAYSQTTEDNT